MSRTSRQSVLDLVFGGIAVFIATYAGPREMPFLERALVWIAICGVALVVSRLVGRLLSRLWPPT